ncbi:hypothetical protein HV019_15805 [Escherichia coli]|nr:hypothetical protein [Escherichia coli]
MPLCLSGGICEGGKVRIGVTSLNLLIEYMHQRLVIAGVSVITIFIVYTLVYTVFSGVPPIWELSGQIFTGIFSRLTVIIFRLSVMKLVDALRYGNPHNDM